MPLSPPVSIARSAFLSLLPLTGVAGADIKLHKVSEDGSCSMADEMQRCQYKATLCLCNFAPRASLKDLCSPAVLMHTQKKSENNAIKALMYVKQSAHHSLII